MLANSQGAKAQHNSVEIEVDGEHEKSLSKKSWPIVAVAEELDEVYLQDLKYPFRGKAKVGSSSVRFLRDTGSSVSIVKQVYVKPLEYVDQETTVLLADRCVRQLPNAVVQVRIPGYEGPLKVCVMTDPVSDFVTGNDNYSSKNDISDQASEISDEDNEMPNETLVFENQSVQKPNVAAKNRCKIWRTSDASSRDYLQICPGPPTTHGNQPSRVSISFVTNVNRKVCSQNLNMTH